MYLKSCLHPDLLVVTPAWLCGQVIGQLLSIDFVAHARITGCYTVDDFQAAFPQVDAMAMLQVLETLQLCIQVTLLNSAVKSLTYNNKFISQKNHKYILKVSAHQLLAH